MIKSFFDFWGISEKKSFFGRIMARRDAQWIGSGKNTVGAALAVARLKSQQKLSYFAEEGIIFLTCFNFML
ncbi:MAG: hypothetical protein LBT84_05145 [Spirochaetia bacterium]|nr:hypothetical protein [Spirochaetia bacterium]